MSYSTAASYDLRDDRKRIMPGPMHIVRSSPAHDIDAHDLHEMRRHCAAVLHEILDFIGTLISLSPHSARWARLVDAEWDRDVFKPVILNFLARLKSRENERGIKHHIPSVSMGRRHFVRRYVEAARGIAQIQSFVERGLPVFHRKMDERELILMGKCSAFIEEDW